MVFSHKSQTFYVDLISSNLSPCGYQIENQNGNQLYSSRKIINYPEIPILLRLSYFILKKNESLELVISIKVFKLKRTKSIFSPKMYE